jgi:hypothetical protein
MAKQPRKTARKYHAKWGPVEEEKESFDFGSEPPESGPSSSFPFTSPDAKESQATAVTPETQVRIDQLKRFSRMVAGYTNLQIELLLRDGEEYHEQWSDLARNPGTVNEYGLQYVPLDVMLPCFRVATQEVLMHIRDSAASWLKRSDFWHLLSMSERNPHIPLFFSRCVAFHILAYDASVNGLRWVKDNRFLNVRRYNQHIKVWATIKR